jgi:phosphoribosylformylglycinamidine synthase
MDTAFAFNETQSRYLVTYPADKPLNRKDVPFVNIGKVGGGTISVNGASVSLSELRAAHESFFKDWMEG